jgi:uncharacterized membrane protein
MTGMGKVLVKNQDYILNYVFWSIFLLICIHPNTQRHARSLSIKNLIINFLIPLSVLVPALQKKRITLGAFITSLVLGFCIQCSNSIQCFCVIFYFIITTKATHQGLQYKKKLKLEISPRRSIQVLCNVGTLALCCLLDTSIAPVKTPYIFFHATESKNDFYQNCFRLFAFSSLACSAGDTFSSELGPLYRVQPVLILYPWKSVHVGTNGGITWFGTLMSLLAGILLGIAHIVFTVLLKIISQESFNLLTLLKEQYFILFIAIFSSVLGSLIDSLLGSSFQYTGLCLKTQSITEIEHNDTRKIAGRSFLTNNMVNFFSGVITPFIIISFTYFYCLRSF